MIHNVIKWSALAYAAMFSAVGLVELARSEEAEIDFSDPNAMNALSSILIGSAREAVGTVHQQLCAQVPSVSECYDNQLQRTYEASMQRGFNGYDMQAEQARLNECTNVARLCGK